MKGIKNNLLNSILQNLASTKLEYKYFEGNTSQDFGKGRLI